MADDNAKLMIVLEAQSRKLQSQLVQATRTIDRFADQTNRKFDSMNAKNAASFDTLSKRVSTSMVALNAGIAKAFAGAAALRGAQQLIDASIRIENSLKIAGLAGEELESVYNALFASAQRNATPVESLVDLYGKLVQVQGELGVTGDELLSFTDNIAVALRVSGKSAAESSGALLQLSQALGGGIVRAEEFNSIQEGALPINQAVAAGLEEAGGSVAKLRQLVVEGEVSSEAYFRAFEVGSAILTDKVANAEFTISQGFIRLQNVLEDLAGKFNRNTGAAESFAHVLESVAVSLQRLDGSRILGWLGELNELLESSGFLQLESSLKEIEAILGFLDSSAGAVADSFDGAAASIEQSIAWALGFEQVADAPVALREEIKTLAQTVADGTTDADELRQALLDLGVVPFNLAIQIADIMKLGEAARIARGEVTALNAGVAADGIALQRSEQGFMRPKAAPKTITLEQYPVVGGGGGAGKSPGESFDDVLKKQRERQRLLEEETATLAALGPLLQEETALMNLFATSGSNS